MAAEVTALRPRAESYSLQALEERLRAHLEERLGVRTRAAPLADVRALLVSPAEAERPKGLVVADSASAAERVYLYVHLAAHLALGHNLPLVTIVEGAREADARHADAEALARTFWWGNARDTEALGAPALARRSALLRRLLATRATRVVLRALLLGMRAAYYRFGAGRALERSRITAWLRQALCVTAVVSAAPQLSEVSARRG